MGNESSKAASPAPHLGFRMAIVFWIAALGPSRRVGAAFMPTAVVRHNAPPIIAVIQSHNPHSHSACQLSNQPSSSSLFATTTTTISHQVDPDYPYVFRGRCIFVPSLVRLPNHKTGSSSPDKDLSVLNVAGWTVGGTVVLEYDQSAVGYYREWVDLGGLAVYQRKSLQQQSFLMGQYGSVLYVSRPEAENLCIKTWGLLAQGADISFGEPQDDVCQLRRSPADSTNSSKPTLSVSGWERLWEPPAGRLSFAGLGLFWTPTIKAIWTGVTSFPASSETGDNESIQLPLHRLRLAGSVGLSRFDLGKEEEQKINFGWGLTVDNLVIEISPEISDPS